MPPEEGPAARGPLHGVRVLDMTSVVMGPLATQILGDLGADVITVESAGGDTNRSMGAGAHSQLSGVSMNLLRNKRNIAIDAKHPDGHAAILRLAASCDVFVTNLRPGPLARLGLEYDDVAAVRADVVYCQAQGFPTDGSRADEPAYDDVVQSAGGVADSMARVHGEPALIPTLVGDKVAGLVISYAVIAALFHRERTGAGQRVEVPMVDALRSFVLVEHGAAAIPRPARGPAGYQRILTPLRRPVRTADGWICLFPYDDRQWELLLRAGSLDHLVGDRRLTRAARFVDPAPSYALLARIAPTRTNAEWLAFCQDNDIPVTEVETLEQLAAGLPEAVHPLAGSYGVIPPPVRFGRTPASVRRPAPLIGEHNRDVLSEVGYSDAEISRLEDINVLRTGSVSD